MDTMSKNQVSIQTVRNVFFLFQAEDGIRDLYVTGVQTCALPISKKQFGLGNHVRTAFLVVLLMVALTAVVREYSNYEAVINALLQKLLSSRIFTGTFVIGLIGGLRSEERRVGKECRSRWWRDDEK